MAEASSSSSFSSSSSSSSAVRRATAAAAAGVKPLDVLLRELLQCGLLARRIDGSARNASLVAVEGGGGEGGGHASGAALSRGSSSQGASSSTSSSSSNTTEILMASPSSGYWFGVPESGRLVTYLRDGRTELRGRLARMTYKEAPRLTLCKAKLARTALPTEFHIRDAIGVGMCTSVRTASGEFVRLCR